MSLASAYLGGVQRIHKLFVLDRREAVLARSIEAVLPADVRSVLDVGCGDGIISEAIARSGREVEGVEVHSRESCRVKYSLFDGRKLPFPDASFDAVMLVDVLHHTDNIEDLLTECRRVARKCIVIKDHTWSNRLDFGVLRFMDWVGNRSYGVRLIYNYQKKSQWQAIFRNIDVHVARWDGHVSLYPFPFSLLFENGKHFVTRLEPGV